MKRLLLGITLLGLGTVLGGCPIYPSQQEYEVCTSQGCYSCPDPSYSSSCTPWPCQTDGDCSAGYVCDPNQSACVAGYASEGGPADCSVTGCPSGQLCKLSAGVAQCVVLGGSGDDASSAGSEGGTDAGAPDSTSPNEGGTGPDGGTPDAAMEAGIYTGPCNDDATCGGQGAKCIDGQCTPQLQLCSDGSQCVATGSACVDGVCEVRCSTSSPCPTGYQCDLTRNVCNVNQAACSGSGGSTCQGGTTCVEGHCVPPCAIAGDAGDGSAACPAGQSCVNGGCIPDQQATFACVNDGQSGQLATTCPADAICVHHDCYTACAADGGSPSCSVSGPSTGSVCKAVTIETGTYSVCGNATTLGSDCDPSEGLYCSGGKVCVDGYCL